MSGLSGLRSLFLLLALVLSGCGGSSTNPDSPPPLSAENINLVFVVSPDLAYQTSGDVDPGTANLTSQGLQRSLQIATYLKQQVLGGKNVTSIYALSPMTHLQTANNYPDMAAIGFVQQFSVLNQITQGGYTANNYPINVAYAKLAVPNGTAVPSLGYCPDCAGLDFNNTEGNNDTLVSSIIDKKIPGYYVFSAPWETINPVLTKINTLYADKLALPTSFAGSNTIYAVSISLSGGAQLLSYNSHLNPPATYPVLPSPVPEAACTHALQPLFSTTRVGGANGAVIPANINTNQKIYFIRHAEAHPDPANKFEDGNIVGAGQWRALALPNALRGKISPNMVYSVDPAQWYPLGYLNVSYVRPSLTALPYAIANKLPYYLVSSFELLNKNEPQLASDFFFTGGKFSNQTLLVAWESSRIKPLINVLLNSYGVSNLPQLPTSWPSTDYDTIWSVTLDEQGNLSVDNTLCEGIDSAALPGTAPQY